MRIGSPARNLGEDGGYVDGGARLYYKVLTFGPDFIVEEEFENERISGLSG